MYTQIECLQDEQSRSPVIFLHGFPDSPLMYDAYVSDSERQEPWLQGRGIYRVAFPNRFTNPNYPPLSALIRDVLQHELAQILDERIAKSPTGKIILIAHDWGSTLSWRYIRQTHAKDIEAMVALSVPSSFRWDVWEHGLLAFGWTYSALFGLPYILPFTPVRRFVTHILTQYGGYQSTMNETLYKDTYHYWYGLPRLLIVPFDFIGLRYRPAYLDFDFPVLFMRSPQDNLPSNKAFERAMQAREDCKFILVPDSNHWFPEQHSAFVLKHLREFLA